MKTFTEEQLNSLIDELQLELPALLKAEMSAESLRKDEPPKPDDDESQSAPPAPADDSASPEGAPVQEAAPEAPQEGQEAAPEAPQEGQEAAPGEEHPEAQEGQAEQTLEQAYGALPMEELQAHYKALKAVLMSHMGQQQAPQAPIAPPQASAAPAMKSEPDFGEELKKSEDKIVALEKQIESVTSILEAMVSRPTQKAVTSMAQFVAKSELDKPSVPQLNRAEAFEKIKKVAQRTDLSKSDRALISKFTLDQSVSVKEIEYLLK